MKANFHIIIYWQKPAHDVRGRERKRRAKIKNWKQKKSCERPHWKINNKKIYKWNDQTTTINYPSIHIHAECAHWEKEQWDIIRIDYSMS